MIAGVVTLVIDSSSSIPHRRRSSQHNSLRPSKEDAGVELDQSPTPG